MKPDPMTNYLLAVTAVIAACLVIFVGRLLHGYEFGIMLTAAGLVTLVGALAWWWRPTRTRE